MSNPCHWHDFPPYPIGVATPRVFDKSPVLKPGFVTTKDINGLSGHSIAAQ